MARKVLFGSMALLFLVFLISFSSFNYDTIGINVLSDFCTFAILISLSVFIAQFYRPQKARFFGFDKSPKVWICISENSNDQQSGRQASVHEYTAAIRLGKMFGQTSEKFPQNLLNRLLGLIGQEPFFRVDWEVLVPSDEESFQSLSGNIVAVGGPESNKITRSLPKEQLRFQFSHELDRCQERTSNGYHEVQSPCAFIEKLILREGNSERIVIVAHGHRAVDTECSVDYLREHWRELHKSYDLEEFAFQIPQHLLPPVSA